MGKKPVKQLYHPTSSQYAGQLAAVIGSGFWGSPSNFNRFRILASLLQQHRWRETNQTLQDVWLSPRLLHYIYIFRGSCAVTEFCQMQNSLCVQILCSHILRALLRGTRVVGVTKLWGVEQRAPPIFGRAAITLGIGPHSSYGRPM